MREFLYYMRGNPQRINAKSVEEVRQMLPEAEAIIEGHVINQAKLSNTMPKGKTVDPGRSSIV